MNISLGASIVMPDHFHGIIHIGGNEYNLNNENATPNNLNIEQDVPHGRAALHRAFTVGIHVNKAENQFGPQCKNLASIIRGFKSSVTIQSRQIRSDFAWQPRYYDRIIRNRDELERISEYIRNNPMKLLEDQISKKLIE